ncbi:MAG: DUF4333 domain-containing protein [Deltaproteobacteria bacterium]|nr:DUF4333 domain-containing protein [Deltaproteobacteria bacterium]
MKISDNIHMALLSIGFVATALLACGGKIDQDKLDKLITKMFRNQLELKVRDIDCPKDIKVEEGKEFECEVTVKPKGTVPVIVEITDSSGSVEAKTKYDVLKPKTVQKEIVAGLAAKNITADVDCGKKVRLAKPDTDFKCKAKDKTGLSKDVTVSINDDGDVSWNLD